MEVGMCMQQCLGKRQAGRRTSCAGGRARMRRPHLLQLIPAHDAAGGLHAQQRRARRKAGRQIACRCRGKSR